MEERHYPKRTVIPIGRVTDPDKVSEPCSHVNRNDARHIATGDQFMSQMAVVVYNGERSEEVKHNDSPQSSIRMAPPIKPHHRLH